MVNKLKKLKTINCSKGEVYKIVFVMLCIIVSFKYKKIK